MNTRFISRTTLEIYLSVFIALLISILVVNQPARSSTLEVTNTNNTGAGSLRQAITDANTNPGADTITFNAALNGTPIVLGGSSGEDLNVSGDLDILDSGDLNIEGNGAAYTIIDGGGIDRVFHVCPGGGCNNTVTLSGVTIRNGNALSASGGGIHTAGTMTITNSTIGGDGYGNTANYGGGIYIAAGTTTLDGCNLIGNTANFSGGGIYNDAPAELIIQNNSIIGGGNTADYGGGIHNAAGSVTIHDSIVRVNSADYGGGIFNWEEGTLTIANSTIGEAGKGNSATADGGGIFNQLSGVTYVISSTVSDNDAHRGGGIYTAGTLTITNSTIGEAGSGNTAGLLGGGIYIKNEVTTVDDSTINANQAFNGGGIYNYATLNIQNGSAIGEAGAGNTATNEGGGIYNQTTSTITVTGSTVSANTANYGGGILTQGTLYIQDGSTIGGVGEGNTASIIGGGIYNLAGVTIVDGSTVSANMAPFGGGIYNYATLNIQNGSTIGGDSAGNLATNNGGGIYNKDGTTMVTGSRILNNTANNNGGGVFNDRNGSWVTSVTGSCIVANSATSFFNNQDAQQNASYNWWGAHTGPNTPGADTVGGNVYYTYFLTQPILGCGFYVHLPLILR